MGLFDGAGTGAIGEGAAAELAVHLRLPVLLVLDVAGQAQSAAASVLGFASFDPARPHRRHHSESCRQRPPPRLDRARHRHARHSGGRRHPARQGDSSPRAPPRPGAGARAQRPRASPASPRRARRAPLRPRPHSRPRHPSQSRRAADLRFAAAGPAHRARVRRGLRLHLSACAERLAPRRRRDRDLLAPCRRTPPDDCDACWLPGGYPELHAGTLAGAARFKAGLTQFAASRRFMANAAASWCWGRGWSMPTARVTP